MHYCRPAPDYLPDPASCLLTGIPPQTCLEKGSPSMRSPAPSRPSWRSRAPIGVGYNSIRFDDEVTRHLFWRNLIDPYARANGRTSAGAGTCSTWCAAYALRPEGRLADARRRRPSFLRPDRRQRPGPRRGARRAVGRARRSKLARLVRAPARCGVLPEAAPQGRGARRDRPGGPARSSTCRPLCLPSALHRRRLAAGAAPDEQERADRGDLAADLSELADLGAEAIRERIFTREADLPDGVGQLPIKTIHVNRSPIDRQPADAGRTSRPRWGLDMGSRCGTPRSPRTPALPRERWAEVCSPARRPITHARRGRRPVRRLRRQRGPAPARAVAPDGRRRVSGRQRTGFSDALDELLFRYRAQLPAVAGGRRARAGRHCAARLHWGKRAALTLAAFQDRIDTLAETAEERGQNHPPLLDYAERIAPEPAALSPSPVAPRRQGRRSVRQPVVNQAAATVSATA